MARCTPRADVARWTHELVRCFAHPDDEARGSFAAARLLELCPGPNGVGLLVQSSDATTGLIGNTLVAVAAGRREPVADLVRWVVRYDPPVHNTRRYVVADATIAGQRVRHGDTILAVLAAANRDPAAREVFTFGVGPHACTGARLATTIATAVVETVLDRGYDPASVARPITYRPLANARVPILGTIDVTDHDGATTARLRIEGRRDTGHPAG